MFQRCIAGEHDKARDRVDPGGGAEVLASNYGYQWGGRVTMQGNETSHVRLLAPKHG
jgi:hypothetical protein